MPLLRFTPSTVAGGLFLIMAAFLVFAPERSGVANAQQAVSEAEIPCDDTAWVDCETPLERYRKSFFQGAEVLGGYLFDFGDAAGGMDQSFLEARASFGVPLGSMENLLGVRPYIRTDYLNGPVTVDLPETLYDTGVTMLHRKTWTERLSTTVVLTPSVRSDFTTSENAFRLFGLALVNWQARPSLSLSLGAVYFDRADFNLLPAIGASWTPSPQWRIDATMPRPRISKRLWKEGGEAEGWSFFGGAIGGNTWAVTRPGGRKDELTIRDLRILGGYEVLRTGNRGYAIEGGFAFDRTIEFERPSLKVQLDSAFFLQAALQF